jgi:hypothetical protein
MRDDDQLAALPYGSAEDDDESHAGKTSGRDIPNWGEVVGMIISGNMESRARSPRGGQSGRGRSAGPNYGRSRDRDEGRRPEERSARPYGGGRSRSPEPSSQPMPPVINPPVTNHPQGTAAFGESAPGGAEASSPAPASASANAVPSDAAPESPLPSSPLPSNPAASVAAIMGISFPSSNLVPPRPAHTPSESAPQSSSSAVGGKQASQPARDPEPFGGEAAPQ